MVSDEVPRFRLPSLKTIVTGRLDNQDTRSREFLANELHLEIDLKKDMGDES